MYQGTIENYHWPSFGRGNFDKILCFSQADFQPSTTRDCHGYKKPAGKCHGLLRGTGPGCQVCTLWKPIPMPRVDRFWLELKLRSKWHQRNTGFSHSLQSTPPPKNKRLCSFSTPGHRRTRCTIMYFNIIYWLQNRTTLRRVASPSTPSLARNVRQRGVFLLSTHHHQPLPCTNCKTEGFSVNTCPPPLPCSKRKTEGVFPLLTYHRTDP